MSPPLAEDTGCTQSAGYTVRSNLSDHVWRWGVQTRASRAQTTGTTPSTSWAWRTAQPRSTTSTASSATSCTSAPARLLTACRDRRPPSWTRHRWLPAKREPPAPCRRLHSMQSLQPVGRCIVDAHCLTRLWKCTAVRPSFQLEDECCSSTKTWEVKQELSCTQLVGDCLR